MTKPSKKSAHEKMRQKLSVLRGEATATDAAQRAGASEHTGQHTTPGSAGDTSRTEHRISLDRLRRRRNQTGSARTSAEIAGAPASSTSAAASLKPHAASLMAMLDSRMASRVVVGA
jgi:hypothetical protein